GSTAVSTGSPQCGHVAWLGRIARQGTTGGAGAPTRAEPGRSALGLEQRVFGLRGRGGRGLRRLARGLGGGGRRRFRRGALAQASQAGDLIFVHFVERL